MNKIFADHVTNSAFFLSISKKQCRLLLCIFNNPWKNDNDYGYYHAWRDSIEANKPDSWVTTTRSLEAKGLIVSVPYQIPYSPSEPGRMCDRSYWKVTEAGRLTSLLLIEAGLAISNVSLQKAANE